MPFMDTMMPFLLGSVANFNFSLMKSFDFYYFIESQLEFQEFDDFRDALMKLYYFSDFRDSHVSL